MYFFLRETSSWCVIVCSKQKTGVSYPKRCKNLCRLNGYKKTGTIFFPFFKFSLQKLSKQNACNTFWLAALLYVVRVKQRCACVVRGSIIVVSRKREEKKFPSGTKISLGSLVSRFPFVGSMAQMCRRTLYT